MGIHKRKQESKKTRRQELDHESDQEKKIFFLFFLVEFLFSCFLLLIPTSELVAQHIIGHSETFQDYSRDCGFYFVGMHDF